MSKPSLSERTTRMLRALNQPIGGKRDTPAAGAAPLAPDAESPTAVLDAPSGQALDSALAAPELPSARRRTPRRPARRARPGLPARGRRPPRGRSRSGGIVGLDIEPGYMAAVEACTEGHIAVERAATAPLAAGIMREGEVADVDALAAALKAFFAKNGFGRRVRLGVANQRIVVRTITLPPLRDAKEIDAAVRFHAQEHIPMPLEQAVLEHHSLGIVETAEGSRTRVVLVAARRDMIDRLLAAARQAGLRPEGVDLSAFAMIRALDRGPSVPAEVGGPVGATLYINVGGMTNLALAEGTRCLFTRVVAGGTEALAQELAERRGLTLEHAHGWLFHVGLVAPVENIDGDPEIVSEARAVLGEGVRRIGDVVRNSIDFYAMQDATVTVVRAVLAGPAAAIAGFGDQLAQEVGLAVERGLVPEARPGALGGIDAGQLAVAAGLAVEERP